MNIQLFNGDCLNELDWVPSNSVDAVVTDPPYGLSFMNKKWDYDVPSVDIWREVYRVLKPGGHVLSFGGTRTFHRMAVNIEDAGFEIRDQVMWIYGSGFPKSHNVSKAIDKMAGTLTQVGTGQTCPDIRANNFSNSQGKERLEINKSIATSLEAKQWDGWGSALKPANEPICLARKPLEKGLTLAENVLKYGTGAINVDGCRIGTGDKLTGSGSACLKFGEQNTRPYQKDFVPPGCNQHPQGRWPANILFDEDAAAVLDAQSGDKIRGASFERSGEQPEFSFTVGNEHKSQKGHTIHANSYGGASRFFYVAKASKRERNAGLEGMPEKEWKDQGYRDNDTTHLSPRAGAGRTSANQNHHPTVKPIKLMEYLITLISPPNGTILDPFMGSGSTGVACKNLNRNFIGIELSQEYFEIAKKRIG